MTEFSNRHINRIDFPTKHVLVCEDDLKNQCMIASALLSLFPKQGKVIVSFVSGGLAAAAILQSQPVDLILLDHDMPIGNGTDLLNWMKNKSLTNINVMTFSGIDSNNIHMKSLYPNAILFNKFQVIAGDADHILKQLLR